MITFATPDQRAVYLVGLIVTRWSKIDQMLWSEITHLQTIFIVRHLRARSADVPSRLVASEKVKYRLKHAQRLAKALTQDEELAQRIDAACSEAMCLYDVRCELAHSDLMAEDKGIILRNCEWREQAHAEWRENSKNGRFGDASQKLIPWMKKNWEILRGTKTYSFEDLEGYANRLEDLRWVIETIMGDLPVDGPPIKLVPRLNERGGRRRLTK